MFPNVYNAIRAMIREITLETLVARAIARKSGFRPSFAPPGRDDLGATILAIPPAAYVSGGTVSASI